MFSGGAGYIGSVLVEKLIKDVSSVIVLDDLSRGHREMVHPDVVFVDAV